MLSKKNRLNLGKRENIQILKTARRIVGENFAIYFQKTSDFSKFSVIIPKKTNKKAVQRNFLRRKYYSFIEEVIKEKNFEGNRNIILLHRKNSEELKKIKADLREVLMKI